MLWKKDKKEALALLTAVNGKLDRVLEMAAHTDNRIDALRDVILEGGSVSSEKRIEDGIASLMSYDGAPKAVK